MMSEKEIDYFNSELKSQNMQIVESPEYMLVPSQNPGSYFLKFEHKGVIVQSMIVQSVREWSICLGLEVNCFIISIQN